MVCVSLKNRHDKDKALEIFKAQDAPDCVTGFHRPSKTATDGINWWFCDRRVVLARCQPANCIPYNRPPSPGLRPISKYVASFHAVAQAADKTFLSLCRIGRQQERKQMHASHVVCKHCAKLGARCVCPQSVSGDRTCSSHGPLSPLSCPFAPLHWRAMSLSGVQCLNNFLRTSGQNSLATLKNVSRAICCPHLSAVFPNDRSEAG